MGDKLHIALTFDDHFWAPAYASMRSICLTSRRRGDLVFHLVTVGLSADHRRDIEAIATEFGAQLVDHPIDQGQALAVDLAAMPLSKAFPPIVYARLFLDRFIPTEAERFLYIDCDVYVRAPIEKLFAMDMAGHPIAAASEPGRHHLMKGNDMRTFNKPFDLSDSYFNSGVLLIDRARWVLRDIPAFVASNLESGLVSTLYHDQDILNLVFRDDWLELDPRWNLTKPHPALRSLDPYIVHYTTGQKPWNSIAYVAFGSSYRHVMTRDLFRRYRRYRWARRFASLRKSLFFGLGKKGRANG